MTYLQIQGGRVLLHGRHRFFYRADGFLQFGQLFRRQLVAVAKARHGGNGALALFQTAETQCEEGTAKLRDGEVEIRQQCRARGVPATCR